MFYDLACDKIEPTDSIETMFSKLESLKKNLHLIKYSGKYRRLSSTYNERDNQVITHWDVKVAGYVYSNDDVINLSAHIDTFISTLQKEQENFEMRELKLITSNVYQAMREPTHSSLNNLKNIADTLSGKPNRGAQVCMVILAIVGLICGIIPGLLYIYHINKTDGLWDQCKRQGLSKIADRAHHDIHATTASERIFTGNNFFTSCRTSELSEEKIEVDETETPSLVAQL